METAPVEKTASARFPQVKSVQTELPSSISFNRIPSSTYRFQLRSGFGFLELQELIPYLFALGISDLYLSPLFQSRIDSVHGYDVVDHSRIEPSFGNAQAFQNLATRAKNSGLGILLDLVPNHMGINDPGNRLWNDVLENGPAARSAKWFDIEWNPEGGSLENQVLLPFLGKPFGECLEAGELKLSYQDSQFYLIYYSRRFPIAPTTWNAVIRLAIDNLTEDAPSDVRTELLSIATQLQHLPPSNARDSQSTEERYREQEVARLRLASLVADSPEVQAAVEATVSSFHGNQENPRSWDRLEELLQNQHYRLAYWRVAVDEINYRRFFDINDLAAIRVENEDVFRQVHDLPLRLLAEGLVTGVRIDHPDGLLDPLEYFRMLQANYRLCILGPAEKHIEDNPTSAPAPLYVVAEKILSGDEPLRQQWPIGGTTGYDFLNDVSALLVDCDGVRQLQTAYANLTGNDERPRDVIYHGKRTILQDSMSSELGMIASRLFRLSQENRTSRDFTLPALHRALREVIACFPVYRTYVPSYGWDVSPEDHRYVMDAIRWAKRRNRTMNWAIFDYIAAVLLLEFPAHLPDELKPQWRKFSVRFQQVTGPITAKGVEDTAFYRYFPLASLNEVGAELGSHGIASEQFHRKMIARVSQWPHALSSTATHDTKRGEDVRARLHVLSEVPDAWVAMVQRCHESSESMLQELDGEMVPTLNERYLLYQTLVGTWPLDATEPDQWDRYRSRMKSYGIKAIREAKQHSSWMNPSESYESAFDSFMERWLHDRNAPALQAIEDMARKIAGPGFVNGITQVVLKSTLPGVPDFYQGCEYWDFRLVDPDNRQPVDFATRSDSLKELQVKFHDDSEQLLKQLTERWDDRLKLFITWRSLSIRQRMKHLFDAGDYQDVTFHGSLSKFLFGFARKVNDQWLLVITPRHAQHLCDAAKIDHESALRPNSFIGSLWNSTAVQLPDGSPTRWTESITGMRHEAIEGRLPVESLMSRLFVVILHGNSD